MKNVDLLHFFLCFSQKQVVALESTEMSDLYLLQLSPKKTWEGFIGGLFATIVFGIMVRHVFNEIEQSLPF